MAYLEDMPATCRARGTNPEYPVDLIRSILGEFEKGLNGGIFDPTYVISKIEPLTRHVKWLEIQAAKEFVSDCDPDRGDD